ncbi:hypothetical protein BCR37DRAFT_385305 [Protomyces lactucae-debilis]|uniref:Uncharacterized protein n=1 Tax=Protomyces lactucae-debilis TaxID=2754530 RepID=A0A1Y2FUG8_PROLT|nr:uncharacterized protein BCR37DRAFT_385305 [Protomyces lactucae-debilis]ORY86836.1 hypothetical protein BCR37DRAFT_385305 [Protomyces lactucae-debilis]
MGRRPASTSALVTFLILICPLISAQQVAPIASPALFAANAANAAKQGSSSLVSSSNTAAFAQSMSTAATNQPLTVLFTSQLANALSEGWNNNVSQQCTTAASALLASIASGAIAADTAPVPGNVVACYNIASWEPITGLFAGDLRLYSQMPAQSFGNISMRVSFGKLATLRSFTDSKSGSTSAPLQKRQLNQIVSAFSSLAGGNSVSPSNAVPNTSSSASSSSNTSNKGTTAKSNSASDQSASKGGAGVAPVPPKQSNSATTAKTPPPPSQPVPAAKPAAGSNAAPVAPAARPATAAGVAQPASGLKPIQAEDRSGGARAPVPAAVLPNEKGNRPVTQNTPVGSAPNSPVAVAPQRLLDQAPVAQQQASDPATAPQEVERFQFLAQASLPVASADASGEGLMRALIPNIVLLVSQKDAVQAEPIMIDLVGRTAGFVAGLPMPRGPFVPLSGFMSTYRGLGGRGGSLPGRTLLGLDGSVTLGSIGLALTWSTLFAAAWIFGVMNRFNQRQSYRKLKLQF